MDRQRPHVAAAALVAVAVAVLSTLVGAPAVAGQEDEGDEVVGIELVAHPDQTGQGRRGAVSIVADAAAGSTVARQVIVSNDTSREQVIDVYVGGALVDERGFVPDDDHGLLSAWGETNPDVVTLDPGERQFVDVRITVPDGAPDGEHLGVVWVQPPAGNQAVRKVNRVGIRIYLTTFGGSGSAVAPDPVAETDFVIESMTAARLDDGRPQVRARVRNTGERTIDLIGDLDLDDGPGGLRAGPFVTDAVTTIGVDQVGVVTVTLSRDVPDGPWLARLQLASGTVERAAEATILFPAVPDAVGDEVEAEMTPIERQRRVLIPIASTLLVTALTVLLVLWWGWRRSRRDDEQQGPATEGVAPAVVVEDREPADHGVLR